MADEKFRLDVAVVLGPWARKPTVKANDGRKRRAAPCQLERGRAAKTIADGGDPRGVDTILSCQRMKRGPGPRAPAHDIGA